MTRLVAAYLAVYLVSAGWLAARGVRTSLPWGLLPLLLLVVLPFATGLSRVGFALGRRYADRPHRQAVAAGGLGLLLVATYHTLAAQAVMAVLLGVAGWHLWTGRLRPGPTLAAFLCVGLIYATVWNLNYLLVPEVSGRLQDAALQRIDLCVYGWFGGPERAEGMFPLTRSPLAIQVLENAYVLLFPEVLLVVFVFAEKGVPLGRLFHPLAACYLLGLLVFWVYPTVGPFTFYPESVQYPAASVTGQLMTMITAEYHAAAGGGELNGAAYFIAVPSLHVAMAVVLQAALRVSRPHFWVVLPVNVLMAVSTVALGFHYLIDFPAGVLLAAVVLGVFRALGRPPAGCPQGVAGAGDGPPPGGR